MSSKADVLIVVANAKELNAILAVFGVDPKEKLIPGKKRWYYDLSRKTDARTSWWAKHSAPRVVVTQCEMGSGTVGGSQQTVQEGIEDFKPTCVIGAGVLFGMNEDSQRFGDVLVSKQIFMYGPVREGTVQGDLKISRRGDIVTASERLINLMTMAHPRWGGAPVTFGLIATGEKLIDNRESREELRGDREVLGGDMEAGGIYVACRSKNVEWIVVKAICDFADGNKGVDKDSRQKLAATNSAQFLLHALTFAPWKFLMWRLVALWRWPLVLTILVSTGVASYYHLARPPLPYLKQGWSWAGSGAPGRNEWRLPGSAWAIESLGDKPELVINGQMGQAGWPHEFDQSKLSDFVLRFKMRFPDDPDADGTKLVWMVRTQDRHWIRHFLEDTDVDSIVGYQFSLVKKGKELYLAGRVVRPLFADPVSLDKSLHLGLHCCQSTTEYEVIVRAYHDQLDNCVTAISPTDLTTGRPADPDSGHPALAHFKIRRSLGDP